MNIVDAIIILFLLFGALYGFKKGIIKSVVSFVGTILVIVLSFTLKNSIAVIFYTKLPFFNVGIPVVNILIYEGIAFVIIFAILSCILQICIKISGIIETLLKLTIVLGIPSKILGAIFGFLEMYLFVFVVLFSFSQFNLSHTYIVESKYADAILTKTPILSKILEEPYKAIKEIMDLNKSYQESQNKEELNKKALEIVLKYKVISQENMEELVRQGKIKPIIN